MAGAEGGTRTPTSYLTRPSNVRVCQFRHFGLEVVNRFVGEILYAARIIRAPIMRPLIVAPNNPIRQLPRFDYMRSR